MYGRSSLFTVRAWGLVVALGLLQLMPRAHAAVITGTSGLAASMSGNSATYTVSQPGASGSLPITRPPGAGTPLSGGWMVSNPPTASNLPVFSTSGTSPVPGAGFSGKSVPITASAKAATAAAVGKALGRFAMRAAGAAALFSTGFAIYDLVKELGYAMKAGEGTADNVISLEDTHQICTMPGCYWGTGSASSFVASSGQESCTLAWQATPLGAVRAEFVMDAGSDKAGWCNTYNSNGSGGPWKRTTRTGTASTETSSTPVSEQEIADAIANKAGWPSTSNLAPAIAQMLNSPDKDGNYGKLDIGALDVTGPASVTGQPSTKTTTHPDGSKTTETTTPEGLLVWKGGAMGNSITDTTTTTETDPTGVVTSQSTTVAKQADPNTNEQAQEQADPCEDHPDRMGCASFGDPAAADELSKTEKAVTVTPVDFGGGGSCPQPVSFIAFGHSYAFAYTPLCDRLRAVAPILMVLALVASAYILADSFRVS
jgi:hypothetical protein